MAGRGMQDLGLQSQNASSASIIQRLKQARLSPMAEVFERQREDEEITSKGFEERFSLLLDAQIDAQNTRRLKRLMKRACFPIPSAHVGRLLNIPQRPLDLGMIQDLATCEYIKKGRNIALQGASGSGKTEIACALGISACQLGFKTLYLRMSEFLDILTYAVEQRRHLDYVKELNKNDLIILDEWLTRSITAEEIYPIMDFLEYRCGEEIKKSIIFCTHYMVKDWYNRIIQSGVETASAESCLDRITHNCYRITIESTQSMRKVLSDMKETEEDKEGNKAKGKAKGVTEDKPKTNSSDN